MWDSIDALSVTSHEDFGREFYDRWCDGCKKPLIGQYDTHDITCYVCEFLYIFMCEQCFHAGNFNAMIRTKEERSHLRAYDNPKCDFCVWCRDKTPTKLGSDYHTCSRLPICTDCLNWDTLKTLFKPRRTCINRVWCTRSSETITLDISNVQRNVTEGITKERNMQWASLVGSLVDVPEDFGSIKGWTLITDLYDTDDFSTGFLLEVVPPNRVASILVDDHGRVAVDIAFVNMEEYLVEYNKWDIKGRKNSVFSAYYRLENDLGLYYG